MIKTILLDANILISALDTNEPGAVKYLRSLLQDDDVLLAISPLIRYEVLRGVAIDDNKRHEKLKNILDGYEEFDITKDVSELSSTLFRYAQSVGRVNTKNINKHSFDIFHWATAKCNNFEMGSNDSDLKTINTLYTEYLASNDESA